MENPKVSLIVPAYNAEPYIDKCIRSIVSQSFSNWELILVNDGSEDGTPLKCASWAERDSRIIYISKENEGQGVAKNTALERARGDYLLFVDSDDWIDPNYVESLYTRAKEEGGDLTVCDYTEHYQEKGTLERKNQDTAGWQDELLTYLFPSLCAKLWRRSLFTTYDIRFPDFYFEDIAILPFLILCAGRAGYAEGCSYHYLVREGSTSKSERSLEDRILSLKYSIRLCREKGVFGENIGQIREFVLQRAGADMAVTRYFLQKKYDRFYSGHDELLKDLGTTMLEGTGRKEMVWGSYNLYRAARAVRRTRVAYRFMASSVVSAVSPICRQINELPLEREQLFRQSNVINDCTRRFMHMNPAEFTDVQFALIDFLEERFSLAQIGGSYITLSDAFLEGGFPEICRQTVELRRRDELWRAAWDKFLRQLRHCFPGRKIVMVRMKLAEFYGRRGKERRFPDADGIRKVNEALERYYDYAAESCPEIIDLRVEEKEYYYTDSEFRHGCEPWHLNEGAYLKMAREIAALLEE